MFSRVRYDQMRGMNYGNKTGKWATSVLNHESRVGGTGDLCSATGRKLIAINGGIHQKLDPHIYLDTVLLPELRELHEATAKCPDVRGKVDVVAMQIDSQVGAMDRLYPNQGAGLVFAFNQAVAAYLANGPITSRSSKLRATEITASEVIVLQVKPIDVARCEVGVAANFIFKIQLTIME